MAAKTQVIDKEIIRSDSEKVKLFVVETEEIYRSIYQRLPLEHDVVLLDVSEEFETASIRQRVRALQPDVFLLGTRSCDDSLIEDLEQIREDYPQLGIVLILVFCSDKNIGRLRNLAAKAQGGMAILLRQSLDKTNQLADIIKTVRRGELVLDQGLTGLMFNTKGIAPFVKQLTPRELETLNLLASGYTNEAIADALYITIKTVERYLNSIYGKLRAESDLERRHPRVTAARLYLEETGLKIAR